MKVLVKLIRFFFLVKEIVAKNGDIHFRRYRLLSLPWLRIYIHQILISDYEADFHDHPWPFRSRILKGSYREDYTVHPDHTVIWSRQYGVGQTIRHQAEDSHKITLTSPVVWTFVITWARPRYWGYQTENGWVGHKEYRQIKNKEKLHEEK
jgi:hypothetical protein